jgi:hypothetical protein
METATLTALVSVLLTSSCTAQLLGCEDVGCPSDRSRAHGELNGTTLTVLGVSEVNTSLRSQPPTWTVGISYISAPNTSLGLWHKDFYLGQPPATRLQTSQSVTGCAFFFEGISSFLEFHDMGSSEFEDDITCQGALASECVSSWKSQAVDEVSKAVQAGSLDCLTLASTLQNNPSSQCKNLDGHWGLLSAQGEDLKVIWERQ